MTHQIIIIILITAVKAIFSAADTAFTYLNKAEINQLSKKNEKARKIKELMENSNRFFGVIEVGTNMSELIASAYASMTIVNSLAYLIAELPVSYNLALFIASLIMTIILAYILLVFGGVLPKKYARNNPRKVAFMLIDIIWIMAKLNHPFERLIYVSNRFFSKIFKLSEGSQEKLTEKQIKMIITEGREEGVIASIEKKILFNALKINDITVKKVMMPIKKVDLIDANKEFDETLNTISTYKYTRIPVYKDEIDNVIGVLNIKDIALEYAKNKKVENNIEHLLRKIKFVSPEEKIFDAFKKLQKENQMLAIVRDNDNHVLGIISLEDILEKVVGKIFDEYDQKETENKK
mgnify:FL=1